MDHNRASLIPDWNYLEDTRFETFWVNYIEIFWTERWYWKELRYGDDEILWIYFVFRNNENLEKAKLNNSPPKFRSSQSANVALFGNRILQV